MTHTDGETLRRFIRQAEREQHGTDKAGHATWRRVMALVAEHEGVNR